MTLRQIVTLPDPVLRRKAKPVTNFGKELQTLIDDMIETMREAPGVLGPLGDERAALAVVVHQVMDDPHVAGLALAAATARAEDGEWKEVHKRDGITVSARAQWIVYDPANTVQSVINTAQEIAKYIEMINNQVTQIRTLTDQLNEFKHYESLFGDPKAVLLTTVQPLVTDLRKTELGQTLTALEGAVDAGEAMLYDANGLFTSIGTTFNTPNGKEVTRLEAPYLPVAAVQKTTDNFLSVSTDATARRVAREDAAPRRVSEIR